MTTETVNLTSDPTWPWSLSSFGMPALVIVGLVLVILTVWTYLGVPAASSRRIVAVLSLRLLALVLTMLVLLRPSLAFQEGNKQPSVLLILVDSSESMTIQDEVGGESRWATVRRILERAQPQLQRLQEEQNVTLIWHQFAEDRLDFDPKDKKAKAEGKRTDFGQALHALLQMYDRERRLRGLLILSDGADNGTRYQPLPLASRWRSLPCPIHTFAFGQTTTTTKQQDIGFTSITPEPSPVPVKGKLTVKGTLDAPGFENATVRLRLFLNDREVKAKDVALTKSQGNEVDLATDAPSTPGEIKVTLKVDPLPGEVSIVNNEISTYLTVIKEGISVLLVDKPRFPEPQRICDALSSDPRIRLYTAWRRTDEPSPEQADLFQFDKQHYDVIILGDVTARRLSGGNPKSLTQIQDLVRKGIGLVMMGGYETFGNSDWKGTPIEDLLPVELNVGGQVDTPVRMLPTRDGLRHYIMRLTEPEAANDALWKRLPSLEGMTKLGKPKPGALVLAQSDKGLPIMLAQTYGEGRVVAFAGDTTWQWQSLGQPKMADGVSAHSRFWRQLVVWLARQEDADGNVEVKLDARRLSAGSKLGFSVKLRGRGGVEVKDARFEVKVTGPRKDENPVPTAREQGDERGTFWKTDVPGEYRMVVHGKGKDHDGKETSGEASARFLIYQDDAEMVRQAADHEFLSKLANAGGGKAYRAEDLPRVLQELQTQTLPQLKPKTERWPDWRTSGRSDFLGLFFLLFVSVLCCEWFLRRYWGMV